MKLRHENPNLKLTWEVTWLVVWWDLGESKGSSSSPKNPRVDPPKEGWVNEHVCFLFLKLATSWGVEGFLGKDLFHGSWKLSSFPTISDVEVARVLYPTSGPQFSPRFYGFVKILNNFDYSTFYWTGILQKSPPKKTSRMGWCLTRDDTSRSFVWPFVLIFGPKKNGVPGKVRTAVAVRSLPSNWNPLKPAKPVA